jgi:histidine kinase
VSSADTRTIDATTSMIDGSLLDITTVLKASTSISREVVPAKLLTVLMRIVLENAGAERGFLLLEGSLGLRVQARGERGGEELAVMEGTALEECRDLSVPLVQFVQRTASPVVIVDAMRDQRCNGQAYVQERKPRSILVLPILNRGKSVGVLYLENNLAAGVFTRDRVDLLTLLSGQIAVSSDNAMLYEQLEQKVQERTAELVQEKRKSEELLHNILPVETADELKRNGFAEARQYERVTVLFTDFKGFTELSTKLPPAELVREIDECFKAFDRIVGKHGIEKIKTIGDAYMAAGGLPVPNSTHAENAIRAALEIRDYMRDRIDRGIGSPLGIRIGLHTGPVVAGIVGLKKFQYDIWGDTVNTAARMETSGEPGKVNVSLATYELTRDLFHFEARGELEAKGKGRVPMFFVERAGSAA